MSQQNQEDYYRIIRGLRFPRNSSYCSIKSIEDVLDYLPHDGDIIITSFPKTGSTWLQYIVLQIISSGAELPAFDDVFLKIAPFMEMAGVQTIEELKEPRIYKHHFPYNLVKKNPKAKYLYIYRKPEDTLISYFHFRKTVRKCNVDLDEFFEGFLSGEFRYGRYFEHVLSYLKHKDDENLLMISYEKLYSNREEEIFRIAKFLGEEYYQNILKDRSVLETIIEKTSFEYMKHNLYFTRPKEFKIENCSEGENDRIALFRKGIIGDGKQSLPVEKLKRLLEVMEEVMKGTNLIEEWLK